MVGSFKQMAEITGQLQHRVHGLRGERLSKGTMQPTWGFQWLRSLRSRAANTSGSTAVRCCATRLTMYSLFHRNRERSATCAANAHEPSRLDAASSDFTGVMPMPAPTAYLAACFKETLGNRVGCQCFLRWSNM